MYTFVIRSNMPASKPFVNWVENILVTIRKTGRYVSDRYQEFEAITDGVNRDSEDCAQFRKKAKEFLDKTKDEKQAKRGSKGGRAFWDKHYKMERDNVELRKEVTVLRQTVIHDYFPYAS